MLPKTAPGQERRIGAVRNISALPPRADVGTDIVEPPLMSRCSNVRARKAELFDHLVGEGEQLIRHGEAKNPRGLMVDD
jgi:hypothetical protein